MNVLVFPSVLYEISGYFLIKSLDHVEAVIEKMLKAGQFDMLFIIGRLAGTFGRNFRSTEVRRKAVGTPKSLGDGIAKVLKAIDGVGGDCEDHMFTVLCTDDSLMEQIAKEAAPGNRLCFALVDPRHETHNFTKISPPTDDPPAQLNYFMEKFTDYNIGRK
jgi:hypothetical protein